MLDLVFLAVAIFAIAKASKGEYNETACNIALVVGVIAGLVGCVVGIMRGQGLFVFLNVIVMAGAFSLRFAAKRLADLYIENLVAEQEKWAREARDHSRFSDPNRAPVYTDDTFDDEELRFGKGGYTESNMVSFGQTEIRTDNIFDGAEPLFGKGSHTDNNKVSLIKKEINTDRNPDGAEPLFGKRDYTDAKKVSLDKKKVRLDKTEIRTDSNVDGEELRFGESSYTDPKQ